MRQSDIDNLKRDSQEQNGYPSVLVAAVCATSL